MYAKRAHEAGPTQFQRGFAEAIFSANAPIPAAIRTATGPAHVSRFGVYRNNVIAGLVNAVAARFPVVKRLLWEDTFARVAYQYVTSSPPRSPVLLGYGDSFPQFLRDIGQSASAYYVADVAELESLRTRAYHAADAVPLPRHSFSGLAAEELPGLKLKLHPSVALMKSRFPVISIWQAALHANDNLVRRWNAEYALISRPYLDVAVRQLSAGAFQFLSAISAGETVGEAVSQAAAKAADFDLTKCFAAILDAEIVIELEIPTERVVPAA